MGLWFEDAAGRTGNRFTAAMRPALAAMLAAMMAGTPMVAQQQGANGTFTLKVQSDIVLTNVVVRDKKTGEVVKGLKASDFTILENGKPQKIASFDYQNVDEAAVLHE